MNQLQNTIKRSYENEFSALFTSIRKLSKTLNKAELERVLQKVAAYPMQESEDIVLRRKSEKDLYEMSVKMFDLKVELTFAAVHEKQLEEIKAAQQAAERAEKEKSVNEKIEESQKEEIVEVKEIKEETEEKAIPVPETIKEIVKPKKTKKKSTKGEK